MNTRRFPIKTHILSHTSTISSLVRQAYTANSAPLELLEYSTPEDMVQHLNTGSAYESSPQMCIIEENAMKGITKKDLKILMSATCPILFVKNNDQFYLNPPEIENSDERPAHFFFNISELSESFLSLFFNISEQYFVGKGSQGELTNSILAHSMFVHELRTPLMIIQGKCRSILKRIPESQKSDPWVKEIVHDCQKILTSCEKLKRMSNSSFQKITAKREQTNLDSKAPQQPLEKCHLIDVIWTAIEDSSMAFKTKVEILDAIQPDIEIECQREPFTGAIVNLINNAYDAVHEMENPWIKVATKADETKITILVTDSGRGIPHNDRIFEPFFSTKEKKGGRGIGLHFVKSFIEDMGGTIRYLLNEDHNTTFEIRLPRKF